MKYIINIVFFGLIASVNLGAQQMPTVSMFESNQTFYNPGAIGNQEVLSASFFYRANWLGFEGAPSTQVFCAHAPLRNPAVALGVLVEHDALGGTGYTGVYFNYAYRLRLGPNKLSFGLKGGINSGSQDYFTLRQNPDPTFAENNRTFFVPNFGVGILYYGRQYWAGISVPRLFGFKSQPSGKYTINHYFYKYEYFISAGGMFPVSGSFSVDPSAQFIYSSAYPFRFSVMGMAVYKDAYKAGIGYRSGEAIILAIGYQLNRQFSLSYSYDLNIGYIANYSSGSHEINISYKFGYNVNVSNPRKFD